MGTIGNRTGLANESECTQCPGGFYCETAGRYTVTGRCQGGRSNHSMHFFSSCTLVESPPRDLQIAPYKSNNGLLMRSTVERCFAAKGNVLLMRNCNHAN